MTTESANVSPISGRRQAKRDNLLDAATVLLAQSRWSEISMEQIARQAGVTRQTVYNEFGSRAALEAAYVKREVDRFLDRFETVAAAPHEDAADLLQAATLELLSATRSNAMVQAITRGDADDLLSLFTTRGRAVVSLATDRLSSHFTRLWPWLGHDDAAALAEMLVRLSISHGALTMDNDANTARSIAMIAGPFVESRRVQAGTALSTANGLSRLPR